MTIKRFHGSEFAFWDDPEGTLGAVTPGLVPMNSVVVLETTASGYGSPAHVFWQEAKARGYEPLFFAWWECDRANYRLPLLAMTSSGRSSRKSKTWSSGAVSISSRSSGAARRWPR
jgi:hypothetical protein